MTDPRDEYYSRRGCEHKAAALLLTAILTIFILLT